MSGPAGKALPVALVVEDEPLLRMLAVEVVEDAGFTAIEARDADEAVVLLESRTDITLLFTDINMPGSMDGLKLAHAVRDRWPPIKILVVSGKQRLQSSDLPSNSCFIGKPYQTSALVDELRSMAGSLIARGNPTPVSERFCSDSPAERVRK
jgi:two-component system, response regulator PdtaR